MNILVRQPFGYDGDSVSSETGLRCDDESLTVQAGKDEADINTLVKRFGLTGELPSNVRIPLSVDFQACVDFHSAMNTLRAAEEAFLEMPADVRARFDHDPGKLIAFTEDGKNIEEARKLGLAVKVEPDPLPAEPQRVIVVSDDSKAAAPPGGPVATSL